MEEHPYSVALIGSGALIIVGIFFVVRSIPSHTPTISGGLGYFGTGQQTIDTSVYAAQENPSTNPSQGRVINDPSEYTQPDLAISVVTSQTTFDPEKLLAQLIDDNTSTSATHTSTDTTNENVAYAFIPSGYISTTTPQKERSATQEALFNYGNNAGLTIQLFESQHASMTLTLRSHAEDRQDPAKIAAVEKLAQDFIDLGESLSLMQDVPSEAQFNHDGIARGYQNMGAKLTAIAHTTSDPGFLSAVEEYNKTIDAFLKNYTALATLFALSNVQFGPGDAGSVFMFSNSSL